MKINELPSSFQDTNISITDSLPILLPLLQKFDLAITWDNAHLIFPPLLPLQLSLNTMVSLLTCIKYLLVEHLSYSVQPLPCFHHLFHQCCSIETTIEPIGSSFDFPIALVPSEISRSNQIRRRTTFSFDSSLLPSSFHSHVLLVTFIHSVDRWQTIAEGVDSVLSRWSLCFSIEEFLEEDRTDSSRWMFVDRLSNRFRTSLLRLLSPSNQSDLRHSDWRWYFHFLHECRLSIRYWWRTEETTAPFWWSRFADWDPSLHQWPTDDHRHEWRRWFVTHRIARARTNGGLASEHSHGPFR